MSHVHFRYSFNTHISGAVSTHTFQVQFQHTHSSCSFNHSLTTRHSPTRENTHHSPPLEWLPAMIFTDIIFKFLTSLTSFLNFFVLRFFRRIDNWLMRICNFLVRRPKCSKKYFEQNTKIPKLLIELKFQ